MKTTGTRPEAFALSTWSASCSVIVVMTVHLQVFVTLRSSPLADLGGGASILRHRRAVPWRSQGPVGSVRTARRSVVGASSKTGFVDRDPLVRRSRPALWIAPLR